ncbi:Ig-like domain-containing protein, partial [Vibrio vulnificus]|nr:Ig-like domain-containing protein [Vibrio vulnificus]
TYPIVNSANDTLAVVTVLGSGTAYANENNIVFKATGAGLSRVIYTLTNEQDATVKIGVINVSVSETGATNTPPSTPDTTAITSVGTTITITPSITDADSGDNPQLIGVVSPQGASVASTVEGDAVDDAYFTNKSFTFSARSAGLYTVYYTAHDHKGAYNTGKATVTVSGDVGIDARDASFYRSQTSLAYDFTIDLRSYVTAADPSKVEYLKAEFTATSVDKNIAHLTQTSDNKILTYSVPANQTGTIEIKYTAKNASGQDSGIIYISIGDGEAAKIVTLGTTPDVDYDATVTATSTCNTPICDADKTTYQWYFADALISEEKSIEVPDGVDGEVLTVVATPYNTKGVRGISKSEDYYYPLTPVITASVIKDFSLADGVDKNTVNVKVERYRRPVNDALVTAELDSSNATLDNESLKTNSSGEVQFNVTDTVIEPVVLTASSLSVSKNATMNFGRPTIITPTVSKRFLKADGIETSSITFHITDENARMYEGVQIMIEGATTAGEEFIVNADSDSNVHVEITSSTNAKTYEVTAKLKIDPSTNNTAYVYSYLVTPDCPKAGTVNCIKAVNVGDSFYMTAFPSRSYVSARVADVGSTIDYTVGVNGNGKGFDSGVYALFQTFDFCNFLNSQIDSPFGINGWRLPVFNRTTSMGRDIPLARMFFQDSNVNIGFPSEWIDLPGFENVPVPMSQITFEPGNGFRGRADIYSGSTYESWARRGHNGAMCFYGNIPSIK